MTAAIPVSVDDPVNAAILRISEDQISGFSADPIGQISSRAGFDPDVVITRLRAMLEARTIRRIRQTLLTTSLAPGALVAWRVPAEQLNRAFDFLFQQDPFSGHVVIRTTDGQTPGSAYRLWTTLKVPVGYSLQRHCQLLARLIGAEDFIPLPAKKLFALGVGHVRRRTLEPGARTDEPGRMLETKLVTLTEEQWRVLGPLKREFAPEELQRDLWAGRAAEAGLSKERFVALAQELEAQQVVGRFSTFLEHVKKHADGQTVTRYNALFHWAVPAGKELAAGLEVGRHHIMTHAYWREGGPAFNHVNVMGVAHGMEKDLVLAHKAAIDQHLEEAGIPVGYTNVFWGGRSEIKPSEIMPSAYRQWCQQQGVDEQTMRAAPDEQVGAE